MTLEEFLKMFNASEADIIEYVSEEEAIEAVKEDGDALRYVKDQTEAVCIEAVKRNGDALRYVKDQTEAVCIEAVKRNGDALRYVNKSVFTSSESVEVENAG